MKSFYMLKALKVPEPAEVSEVAAADSAGPRIVGVVEACCVVADEDAVDDDVLLSDDVYNDSVDGVAVLAWDVVEAVTPVVASAVVVIEDELEAVAAIVVGAVVVVAIVVCTVAVVVADAVVVLPIVAGAVVVPAMVVGVVVACSVVVSGVIVVISVGVIDVSDFVVDSGSVVADGNGGSGFSVQFVYGLSDVEGSK